MRANKEAVQARYDAADSLKSRSHFGRLDSSFRDAFDGILTEPIPRSMQDLVESLEGQQRDDYSQR